MLTPEYPLRTERMLLRPYTVDDLAFVADVESRDDKHVIRGSFLKCSHDIRIDEAAIAEQHGAQDGRSRRLIGE